MNSTVKLLTRGGRGETRLLLERDQKRDQAKSKGLEISFANCCHQLSTRTINPDFSLEQTHWLPLKWLILRQNETLSYPTEFFYTYPHSLYGFSRIHRFPQFPLGLRFRCVRPACSDGPLFMLTLLTPRVSSGKLCASVANIYLFYVGPTAHALLSNLNFASRVLYIDFIAKCCAPSKLQLKRRCL